MYRIDKLICQIGGAKFLIFDQWKICDPLYRIQNKMRIFSVDTF
jgi:hypothetical protein